VELVLCAAEKPSFKRDSIVGTRKRVHDLRPAVKNSLSKFIIRSESDIIITLAQSNKMLEYNDTAPAMTCFSLNVSVDTSNDAD
jgi:hypothetical protein